MIDRIMHVFCHWILVTLLVYIDIDSMIGISAAHCQMANGIILSRLNAKSLPYHNIMLAKLANRRVAICSMSG